MFNLVQTIKVTTIIYFFQKLSTSYFKIMRGHIITINNMILN